MAVLVAAVRMFNERGFHSTSLDEVAASLGVTKPTVYHYLGNKDRILLECLTIGLKQLIEAADRARKKGGTGCDRLCRFLESYAEINMRDFGQCVIRTDGAFLSGDNLGQYRQLKRRIDTAIRTLVEDGIADGSIAPLDPKILAFTLAGALNWPGRWYDPEGPLEPTEIARRMVDTLARGFLPRSGTETSAP